MRVVSIREINVKNNVSYFSVSTKQFLTPAFKWMMTVQRFKSKVCAQGRGGGEFLEDLLEQNDSPTFRKWLFLSYLLRLWPNYPHSSRPFTITWHSLSDLNKFNPLTPKILLVFRYCPSDTIVFVSACNILLTFFFFLSSFRPKLTKQIRLIILVYPQHK